MILVYLLGFICGEAFVLFKSHKIRGPHPQQTHAVFLTDQGAHTLTTKKLVSILTCQFVSVNDAHTLSNKNHSVDILKSQKINILVKVLLF